MTHRESGEAASISA